MRISRRVFTKSLIMATGAALAPGFLHAESSNGIKRAHGHSLIGPLSQKPDYTHFGYVNADAPKGGEVTLGAPGSFDSFNSFIPKGSALNLHLFINDTLMAPTYDQSSEQYGLLAEWMEWPSDSSWVRYKLREGAYFHDGEPIKASDVVWTLKTLMEHGKPQYPYYYKNVTDVVDEGEGIIKFTFDQKDNKELPHIVGQLDVLPEHWWKTRDFTKASTEIKPLGSGPYKIGNFEPGRWLEMERVKNYWATDLPIRKGQYNFDTLRYRFYKDGDAAFAAFKAGDIDYRTENSASKWTNGYDFDAVKQGRVVKREVKFEGTLPTQYFAPNTRREKFQDYRTRHALALLYDFEWTNKKIYFDQYERPTSFFLGSPDLMAQGLPDEAELALLEPYRDQVPPTVFTEDVAQPKTDGSGRIRKQIRKATKLLKEAGWKISNGILVDKEGSPFKIEFLIRDPSSEKVLGPYVKNLERVGIQAELRQVDSAQYVRRVQSYDYDIITSRTYNSESPGNEQREFWGSEAANRPGGRNAPGVADPVVDAMIEKIIYAENREALAAACRAMDRVLLQNHYTIMMVVNPKDWFAYWDKFSQPERLPRLVPAFSQVWWYDTEKAAALENKG